MSQPKKSFSSLATCVLAGFFSLSYAAPYSQTGSVNVSASVTYILANLSGNKSMNPPAPDETTLATGLNNPANYNTTITVGTPEAFSLYTNAVTPISVTVTNTSGGQPGTSTEPMLKGSTVAGNPTEIPYHIFYTPCGNGAEIDLANQCGIAGNTGCQISSTSNANARICSTAPGSIVYKYDIPAQVNADTYLGQSTLTYSVGA
jgi:hypothetical protein